MLEDVRIVLRQLLAAPVFAAVAILSLAIGIGATAVMFGVVDAVDLRPLPFESADRLVSLRETRSARESGCAGCPVGATVSHYRTWRERSALFEEMAAVRGANVGVRVGDGFVRLTGVEASASLFPMFGVRPLLGRTFSAEDEHRGAEPVALLSESIWAKYFGADPRAVDRTIQVARGGAEPAVRSYTVIGILPSDFLIQPPGDVWVPLQDGAAGTAGGRPVSVMARLKEGVSLGRASGEIAHLVHQIERSEAGSSQRAAEGRNALVRPLRDDFVSDAGSARFVLLGVCSCVLLIVTANLAGLFVARGAARERDLAIRRALGASRLRLARQILAEPVMISLLGGGLALLLANWGMELSMSHLDLEGLGVRAGLDVRILVFVLALAIVVGVASGLASASRLRLIVEGALFQGDTLRTTASRGRVRVQRLFIGAQVACALVLLSIAGMFAREYVRLRQADPGLDVGSLAYGVIQTSDTSAAGLSAFVSRASSSIGEIAGVAGSTLIGFPSFDGSVIPDGRDQPLTGEAVPLLRSVGPDFFEVLGIRVRAGRVFASTDGRGTQRVAIVNELAANRYWPQGDAVGHTIQLRTSDGSSEVVTVVGVVADTRLFDPLAKSEPIMYRPIEQAPGGDLGVFVRAPSSRYEVLTRLRATIATLVTGPTWADGVYWIDDHFSQLLGRQRFVTRAMLAFSLLGIGLAALGVYGLAAQAAAMRTREVGIRIALGAQRHALVLAACKETAIITAAGVGTGVAWSWVATRLIQSLLAGTAPADPRILLSAALLLAAVVMLAGYVPAVRLTRVDPVTALRAE